MPVGSIENMDMESLINQVSADLAQGDIQDKKVIEARVHANASKMRDQRQARIKNLTDQMKGTHGQGGGCFKVLSVVFKVIDFLVKPISAITLNQLKLDLSKTLDILKDAKMQKQVMGMRIKGEQILKTIEGVKKLFNDDVSRLDQKNNETAKETQRILQILDEIDATFKSTLKV